MSTTYVSGSTLPPTTTSPSPNAASTTIRSGSAVDGSAVNRTPARSASTIRCTTTARAGSTSTCLLARYATTRLAYSEAQQSRTRSTSWSSPETLVKVAFIPANEVSLLSSDVAEERTATDTLSPRSW